MKNVDKVPITKEELNLIQVMQRFYYKEYKNADEVMVSDFLRDRCNGFKDKRISEFVSRLSITEFMLVLFHNHYEFKKSPEEELLDYYVSLGFDKGAKRVVEKTLEKLKLTIKGIN